MALPTISSVVAQMSTLVDTWHGYTSQLRAWLAGTASGGPGSDGSYPLTDDQGNTFLVPSPAAQAARVDAVVNSAQSYATAADSSAAAAATSAMNAGSSETAAAAHRDDAQTAASTAEMYATAAGNSAADALSSKSSSALSESASSASAAAAAQSATDAQTAATSAEASATTATTQAASATSSANDAYASALTAQTYVTGLLRYAGVFDASTGTFPANPTEGDFWKVGTAGTVGGVDLAVGDQIIWSGSGWDKIDNTESVTSVAGRVGSVTLSIADVGGLGTSLAGKQPMLGFTPVQQGTGVGQNSNAVKLGWNGTFLLCTVDTVDQGAFAMQSWVSANYTPNISPVLSNGQPAGSAVAALKIGTAGFGNPVGFFPRMVGGNYNNLVQGGDGGIVYSLTGTNSVGFSIVPYGGGGGLRLDANGNATFGGGAYLLAANAASVVRQPRIFVQSTDPGAAASDGDLWFW